MKTHEQVALQLLATGYFSVDGEGRIWRNRIRTRTGRELEIPPIRAEHAKTDGYSVVRFGYGGHDYTMLAHRMVWLSLFGPIPERYEVNHKDGKRSHNHPHNLELLTPGENTAHSYRELGRWRPRGELNGRSKLTRALVAQLRQDVALGMSIHAASREYQVSRTLIKRIITGQLWGDTVSIPDEFPRPDAGAVGE